MNGKAKCRILPSHKKEWSTEPWKHYGEWKKPDTMVVQHRIPTSMKYPE